MELRQVRYFLSLSRTLNFTRAAEECNVTQPTLTLAIKKLEDELGGPLLHRERNRTHLTHLGQMVLPFLEQVYESSAAVQMLAQDLARGDRVPFSLGVSDVVDKAHLIQPIRAVRDAAEGLELHVEGGADAVLVDRLLDGALDLALLDETVVTDPKIRFHQLYRDEMNVLMPVDDPLSGQNALDAADIVDRHFIGLVASKVHEDFATAARHSDPHWMQQHRAGRPTEAQLMALTGIGLALVGNHEPLLEGLVRRPLSEPMLTRTVGLAEVAGRRSSSAAMTAARLLRAQDYMPS